MKSRGAWPCAAKRPCVALARDVSHYGQGVLIVTVFGTNVKDRLRDVP
jgi:hypothetical protein